MMQLPSKAVRQISSPNVRYPELFWVVFQALLGRLQSSEAPTALLPSGRGFVRITDTVHIQCDAGSPSRQRVLNCLKVRDNYARADGNRFSGSSPDGSIVRGGLYVSMNVSAIVLETQHYAGSLEHAAKQGKTILNLQLNQNCSLLDLSGRGPAADFVASIGNRNDVRAAIESYAPLKGKTFTELLFSETDYSVPRAVGLAASFSGAIAGVMFKSARTTDEMPTGDNVVLFGSQHKIPMSRLGVQSIRVINRKKQQNGGEDKVYRFDELSP